MENEIILRFESKFKSWFVYHCGDIYIASKEYWEGKEQITIIVTSKSICTYKGKIEDKKSLSIEALDDVEHWTELSTHFSNEFKNEIKMVQDYLQDWI